MMLDLTPGVVETSQYNAWSFPGGEIHFKLKSETIQKIERSEICEIVATLTSPEAILFFIIVVETLEKDFNITIVADIKYMPYQQADRDFGKGECFSLKTITRLLNDLPVKAYRILDPHSDVTPALLNNAVVEDNSDFIRYVIAQITGETINREIDKKLTILSPDAGAYKKIFKLCEKIDFKGSIETANKYRDTTNGELQVRLSKEDFEGQDVLIIDDICMGGRTFVELAKLLKNRNVGKLYLAVSHGIFSVPLKQGLSLYFSGIFTTDSFRDHDSYKDVIQTMYLPYDGSYDLEKQCFFNIFKL